MSDSILDVKKILEEYSTNIKDSIIEESKSLAKAAVKELKQTSPKKTGKYAKSWTTKDEKRFEEFHSIVHNSKKYQLTHLLEKGHVLKRNGTIKGNVKSKKHIAPVEEKYVQQFEKNVESIIGGKK